MTDKLICYYLMDYKGCIFESYENDLDYGIYVTLMYGLLWFY
jgi:hypothetical protein